MARPATTHVIEIESGIGEPAFIPLTLGQELQPISVGKKGMWRVEGAKVLEVHAFVYFDGTSLFLQSADEQNAALVDGYRVGKAWTELHAPCRIEIGAAKLRFRSLIGDAQAQAPGQGPTVAQARPPVQPPPAPPLRETQQSAQPPRPAAGEPPMTFPKPERPFAPGALAAMNDDDESTRIAPVEVPTGTRPLPGMSGSISAVPAPRPAAGRPADDDLSTRPEAARGANPPTGQLPSVQIQGSGAYGAMPGQPPMGMPPPGMMGPQGMMGQQASMPPGMVQGVMPLGSMPPGMPPGAVGGPMASGGYPAQPGYPPQGFPPQGTGAYGTLPSGAMPPMGGPGGPSMPPGGYGSTTQGGQQQQTSDGQGFSDLMKDPAQRKKLMALGVILLGGAYVLLMDDDPPAQQAKKAPMRDGGADAAMVASGSAVPPITTPTNPPTPACPPGFQPYGTVQPGQPITCVPAAPTDVPDAGTTATAARDGGGQTDAGAKTTPAGQKTLERQAIDYVATGEYAKAIGIYEKLSQQNPDNKVYSEALRILRAKLDAGVP